ncbi:hypothetical protein [Acidovorax sp. 1608163]|uniref:hypothetical protein n=1 Tax=Acidovorax sp. 1608163 TaxID=2478662 RepID=UPI0013CEE13E|nr:hypothetical protein [Acidovorax sp. 1608163]
MTDAERQRKHRLKRQRELQALRAVVPATPQERESVAQVQRLAVQLDKATANESGRSTPELSRPAKRVRLE